LEKEFANFAEQVVAKPCEVLELVGDLLEDFRGEQTNEDENANKDQKTQNDPPWQTQDAMAGEQAHSAEKYCTTVRDNQ